MSFNIYLLIGVFVSVYMIHYYKIKQKKTVTTSDALLAVIGPFVWPLQIAKHIFDRLKFESIARDEKIDKIIELTIVDKKEITMETPNKTEQIENEIIALLNKAEIDLNRSEFESLAESIIDYIDEIGRSKK